jgi:hypothetical protein
MAAGERSVALLESSSAATSRIPTSQRRARWSGHRDDEPFTDTDVPGFRRRELLPTDDPAFDFNVSLLAFDPGVGLDKVEIHDEEHGLYMTAGGGTYLLEDASSRCAPATSSTWRPTARSRSSPATSLRIPALQGRLARRFLTRARSIRSSRPLNRDAPVDTGRTETLKGKPAARRGRKARGLRRRRWLGCRSADHHVTQPCARPSSSPAPPACSAPPWRWPLAAPAHAADAPFTPRFAQTARGDVTAVGNTLLTCPTRPRLQRRAERHRAR